MNSMRIINKLSFFLVILLILAGQALAQDHFQKGIGAYGDGRYGEAVTAFEQAADAGVSAALLYNLGNSYAQTGRIGMAVLNYERALRLLPGDSDVRGNLELVRKENGLFQEKSSSLERFSSFLSLDQWTVLAAFSFVAFCLFLLLPSSFPPGRKYQRLTVLVSFFILFSAIAGGSGSYTHYHDGVVVGEGARLQISPFASAASIGTIREGRRVTPLQSHNNYELVKDESGRKGWLKKDDFLRIASF